MPVVEFTPHLARQTNGASCAVEGSTLGEALSAVFTQLPGLRSYVLDDQGAVRHHVVIFVDGTAAKDRKGLSDALRSDSEIFIMQALSGG